ncbi:envelope glycoprotein [Marasmius crinis-equi]|uniref:Envelope glycoprotein n=1 Tax=Marasmius crinis-equi TaxID=585013 RepID=A0ABR3G2T0_9AGAR
MSLWATYKFSSLVIQGTNLMITGIALQVVMMAIFVILVAEYMFRYLHDRPIKKRATTEFTRFPLDTRRQILLLAMGLTIVLLFIRGIYRLIELSGGWGSNIMRTEWLFNVFDGAMIFLSMLIWNVAHPAVLLEVEDDARALKEKIPPKLGHLGRDSDNSDTTIINGTV